MNDLSFTEREKKRFRLVKIQTACCLLSFTFAHFIICVSLSDSCKYLDFPVSMEVSVYPLKHSKPMLEEVSDNQHLMYNSNKQVPAYSITNSVSLVLVHISHFQPPVRPGNIHHFSKKVRVPFICLYCKDLEDP